MSGPCSSNLNQCSVASSKAPVAGFSQVIPHDCVERGCSDSRCSTRRINPNVFSKWGFWRSEFPLKEKPQRYPEKRMLSKSFFPPRFWHAEKVGESSIHLWISALQKWQRHTIWLMLKLCFAEEVYIPTSRFCTHWKCYLKAPVRQCVHTARCVWKTQNAKTPGTSGNDIIASVTGNCLKSHPHMQVHSNSTLCCRVGCEGALSFDHVAWSWWPWWGATDWSLHCCWCWWAMEASLDHSVRW